MSVSQSSIRDSIILTPNTCLNWEPGTRAWQESLSMSSICQNTGLAGAHLHEQHLLTSLHTL